VRDRLTGKVMLTPLLSTRLIAGDKDVVHAFWYTAARTLSAVTYRDNVWGAPVMMATAAADMDAYTDISGTLHLVYVRTVDRRGDPAGVYYRTSTDSGWTQPQLIVSSPLFRTATGTDTHIRIASDASGRIVMAWQTNDVGAGYARSTDRGATWQPIPALSEGPSAQMKQPVVGATRDGEFLILWRSVIASSCALTQRRSTDAGATWDAPQTVLTSNQWCSDSLSIRTDGQNRLWLLGVPDRTLSIEQSSAITGTGTLGAALTLWDRKAWFVPPDMGLPASQVG
jgi:hypothetical protein